MKTTHVEHAHDEWDYTHAESDFHDDGIATSIPCQLEFTEEPEQDLDRFHDALDERGWTPLEGDYAYDRMREKHGAWYKGEVASTDHYNRVLVRVLRGNKVRLYPHDDYVPDVPELASLTRAIEIGFGAELEHSPIED